MDLAKHPPFHVGPWRIDPPLNQISRADEEHRVEPRIMRLLVCLAGSPGQVRTRDELTEQVWPDTVVVDDTLTHAISDLRKIFDDPARDPDFIETIPKTGYRLIAPVTPVVPPPSFQSERPAARGAERSRWAVPSRWTQRLVLGGLAVMVLGTASLFLIPPPATSPALTYERSVPLTSLPGFESTPALSPDGRSLAFAWNGGEGDAFDLYVKLVNAPTLLRLTEDPASDLSPTWSPDGTRIAFVRTSAAACGILEVSALGGALRTVTSCTPGSTPDLAWSPDGTWLAFTDRSEPDAPHSVYLVSPTSLERRRLTQPEPNTEGDQRLAFAPDGQSVAFTRTRIRGIEDLYYVSLDGEAPVRLTSDSRRINHITWMPDGERVLFASSEGCMPGLWSLPITGGRPSWVTTGSDTGNHPTLSRSGDRLAYERWHLDADLWQLRLDGDAPSAPVRVLSSTYWDGSPQFSPDGEQVVFVSSRSGHLELWLGDLRSQEVTPLTAFEGPYLGNPRWSPDGKALAFDVRQAGQAAVHVLDLETRRVRQISRGASNDMAPSWSRDGQFLYVGSDRSGSWQLWRLSLDGDEATQVTQRGGFTGVETTDGTALYVARRDTSGLWSVPLDGGPATLVTPRLRAEDWGNWAYANGGVYFVDTEEESRPGIAFYDEASGRISRLADVPGGTLVDKPGLTVAPEGDTVLFARVERRESDIMMVEQ